MATKAAKGAKKPVLGKPDVVVAGHICLDVIPDLTEVKIDTPAKFYIPGKLLVAKPATLSTGGPVSNTGLNLLKMGINTALMGKVGADPFGEMVALLLKRSWGVSKGMITDPGVTTSYTIVVTPHGYDRMFIHDPGANAKFYADDIDYDLVAKVKLFHLGYPPLMRSLFENDGRELVKIFCRVKKLGVTTSLDMSLPDHASPGGQVNWRKIHEKLVPYLDIYLPSFEEILFMLERDEYMKRRAANQGDLLHTFSGDDLHRLSDKMLDMGATVICLKGGYRGYYCRTAGVDKLQKIGKAKPGDWESFTNREFWHPTFHIDNPPQATGSGDSSIAGFYAAYLRGLPLDQCVVCANATGASNCTRPDALSGVLEWSKLQKALKTWKKDPVEVTGRGWRRDTGPITGRWLGPSEKVS